MSSISAIVVDVKSSAKLFFIKSTESTTTRQVCRSYEEFKMIDKYVRLQPGFETLPELPELKSVVGFLPGKQQKRIAAVNNWLAALLRIDDLLKIPALRQFLNLQPSKTKICSFKRVRSSISHSLVESRRSSPRSSVCSVISEKSNDSTATNGSDLTVATLATLNDESNWERVVQYAEDEHFYIYDRALFEPEVYLRMFPVSSLRR
jgi:hypothetical protein